MDPTEPPEDRDRTGRDVVERRIRRTLGIKTLRDIQRWVDGFRQEQADQRAAGTLVIIVVALLAIAGMVVVFWPPAARLVAGLLGP